MLRFSYLRSFVTALLLGLPGIASAQSGPPASAKIKVYLVGTFHFNGSGSDVVKGGKTDMSEARKKQEVDALISRLAKTNADKVLIEQMPSRQAYHDSTYALYRQNKFTLGNNEVYQVGYRLAAALNRPRLYCVDANGVFDYGAASEYANTHGQEATLASALPGGTPDSLGRLIRARVGAVGAFDFKDQPGETLSDKLARMNSNAYMRANMDAYLLTLARIGGPGNYSGADLAGEFFQRNVRIYANLLRAVDVQRDKAVVLLIGAGHVSFLKEILQYNSLFEVQDIVPLLTTKVK